jgi:hypothetical protein
MEELRMTEEQAAKLKELKAVFESDLRIALEGKAVVTPKMLKEILSETSRSLNTTKKES